MDTKDKIIKALLETPNAKSGSGGSEIIVTCPKCGQEHLRAGPHLYIEANGEVMRINCFHCPLSGVLTPELLHQLNINDPEFDDYLLRLNNTGLSKIKTSTDSIRSLIFPTHPKTDTEKAKIEYAINRTGIDFYDPEIIKSHKFIFNLSKFLEANDIYLDDNPLLIKELSEHALGFISYNNNTINMRNINSSRLKRYTNIKINKNIKSPFIYIPPAEIDLLTPNPMIVVAEGAFDILCIKNRFYSSDSTNIIFGAVGTKASYKVGIKKLIGITCYFGSDITIFSDKDANLEFYKNAFKSNLLNTNNFKIIYNDLNKDFGNINENYKFHTYKLKRID